MRLVARRRLFVVLLAAMLSVSALAGPAMAVPGDPIDPGNPALACAAGGVQCQDAVLSPIEMRAANAAAAEGQAVRTIELDTNLGEYLWYDYWRLVNGPITVYDGPNGNPIRAIEQGFYFVSALGWDGPWAMINYGEWVSQQNLQRAQVSTFKGVLVPEHPDRPFGWMLLDTYPSYSPAGPPNPDINIRRYELLTVYATVNVDGWNWYLIGPDQWVEQRRVALVHPVPRPEGVSGRWIAVDLYEQIVIAYEDDEMVFATLVSSGLPRYSTREGLFKVWSRIKDGKMSGFEGEPEFYFLQNVPWSMYFDGDISLHGAYWHDRFGYRQSRGCVNLSITDAAWLYEWTEDQEETWVYVYRTGDYVR